MPSLSARNEWGERWREGRSGPDALTAPNPLADEFLVSSALSSIWACFEKTDDEVGVIWLVVLVFEVNGRMVTQSAVSPLAIVEALDVIEDFCARLAAGSEVAAIDQF